MLSQTVAQRLRPRPQPALLPPLRLPQPLLSQLLPAHTTAQEARLQMHLLLQMDQTSQHRLGNEDDAAMFEPCLPGLQAQHSQALQLLKVHLAVAL